MSRTTMTDWLVADIPGPDLTAIMKAHLDIMVKDGKTDGVGHHKWKLNGTVKTTERTWTTVEDAQEWITYVNGYGALTAVIVPIPPQL